LPSGYLGVQYSLLALSEVVDGVEEQAGSVKETVQAEAETSNDSMSPPAFSCR